MCLLLSLLSGQEWEKGTCVRVLDGDTIDLIVDSCVHRCRLKNVDAPELEQPFGRKATDSLHGWLWNEEVLFKKTGTDSYGRWLVELRVRNQEIREEDPAERAWLRVDSLMITRGWAWYYRDYGDRPALLSYEEAAREANLGLWDCPEVIAPWHYRQLRRYVDIHFEGCE